MSYQLIGSIASTHGLDGRVSLRHHLEAKNAWKKLKHVFVEVRRDSFIPYFIEDCKIIANDEVLVSLDEIDSMELAKSLAGKKVYIEEELYREINPKGISGDMIGFMVEDTALGNLGVVEDLFETPGQVLATIQYQGKEVLIPLVSATIVHIDGSKRTIKVNLPDGLLDIYL